jgi:uncharacterized RDD family membrane protein YckC
MKIAGKSYRAINYAIDLFFISLIVQLFNWMTGNQFITISLITIYFFYYLIFEITIQKTLGKMVTKTMVVDFNDQKPRLRNIILRSVCRLFYLDLISFLMGTYGIHDGYSKTKVVKVKS